MSTAGAPSTDSSPCGSDADDEGIRLWVQQRDGWSYLGGGWTYVAQESVDEPPIEIMARFLVCD